MLFFPNESAPAKAPNKHIVGVPITRLIIKGFNPSWGRYRRNIERTDRRMIGKQLKIQFTRILISTIKDKLFPEAKRSSMLPSSKSSKKIFWKDNNVDKSIVIQIKPGAKFFKISGSFEIPIGYREIEIKKNTIGVIKKVDFLE